MKDLLDKIIKNEAFRFIVTGGMTTIVNFVVFHILDTALMMCLEADKTYKISYGLSFIISVLFSFFVSKFYVFRSSDLSLIGFIKEFTAFFSARLFSGGVVFILLILLVELFSTSHMGGLVLSSCFNIIFNYFAGRFIFRRK